MCGKVIKIKELSKFSRLDSKCDKHLNISQILWETIDRNILPFKKVLISSLGIRDLS